MYSDTKNKADDLIKEADKLVTQFSFLSLFKKSNYQKAADKYKEAAGLYNLIENSAEFANSWLKHAEILIKLQNRTDAVKSYLNAARSFSNNCNIEQAQNVYEQVIQIYIDFEETDNLAIIWNEMAEMFKQENIEQSINTYIKAINYFEEVFSHIYVIDYAIILANIYIDIEKYEDAYKYYDKAIKLCIQYKLKMNHIKEYITKSILLLLFNIENISKVKDKLSEYLSLYNLFRNTKQYTLIRKVIYAIEDHDILEYTRFTNNNMQEINDLKLSNILLKIKNKIIKLNNQHERNIVNSLL